MNKEDKGTITLDAYWTYRKEAEEAVAKEIFDAIGDYVKLEKLEKKYNYKKQ